MYCCRLIQEKCYTVYLFFSIIREVFFHCYSKLYYYLLYQNLVHFMLSTQIMCGTPFCHLVYSRLWSYCTRNRIWLTLSIADLIIQYSSTVHVHVQYVLHGVVCVYAAEVTSFSFLFQVRKLKEKRKQHEKKRVVIMIILMRLYRDTLLLLWIWNKLMTPSTRLIVLCFSWNVQLSFLFSLLCLFVLLMHACYFLVVAFWAYPVSLVSLTTNSLPGWLIDGFRLANLTTITTKIVLPSFEKMDDVGDHHTNGDAQAE